jgi:hypothetical protein
VSNNLGETIESERFREIMELKKDVHEIRDQIDRAMVRGEIREPDALALYQRKVRDYVMAVETVLNPAGGDPSRFWTDEPIGDFALPDGREEFVTGLEEFLELPETYDVEVGRTRKRSYRHAVETVTETQRVRPPKRLIEHAFRATNKALDAAGFDIDEPAEPGTSSFNNMRDTKKASQILHFLGQLDDDGLREWKAVIDEEFLSAESGALTNGDYE